MNLVIIAGMTCSGKSTALKYLTENYKIDPIISYTTRPMRNGEIDGVDYHFVDESTFKIMDGAAKFLETTSYKQKDGAVWRYGTLKSDYYGCGTKAIILNPQGIVNLLGIKMNSELLFEILYLTVPEHSAKYRYLITRDLTGDTIPDSKEEELKMRLIRDKNDFFNFKETFNCYEISNGSSLTNFYTELDRYARIHLHLERRD